MYIHLAVCGLGAALSVAGHLRCGGWALHVAGLAVMLLVTLQATASTVLWLGVAVLAGLAVVCARRAREPAQRVEVLSDGLAMGALLALQQLNTKAVSPATETEQVMTMGPHGHMSHGVVEARMSGVVWVLVVVAVAWGAARFWAASRRRASEGHRTFDGDAWWRRVTLIGSSIMLAGMALMLV